MLKNKFKIIALLMVIIFSLMAPIVRAEDNEADGHVTTQEEIIQGAEALVSQNVVNEENYKQSDVYLKGDEITIDYTIDGNLFVMANTVNINAPIGGDAFIIANNILIDKDGYIFSNLFSISQNITINGSVYDVFSYSSNSINIDGYIYRDVRAITNNFTLTGTIGRNAFLNMNSISISSDSTDEQGNTVTSQGSIHGNLNYTSGQEITIQDGIVTGDINFTQESSSAISIQTYILSLGKFLVTVLVIWLLCLWLAPKFLTRTDYIISKKMPSTIGLGILAPIVLIIIFSILLLLEITSTIGAIGLITLLTICAIGSSIFVISFNNLVCKKFKIEKTIGKLGVLIITAIIIWLIALIPFVGKILSIILSLLGIGILVNSILLYKKDLTNSKSKSKNNEINDENKTEKNK